MAVRKREDEIFPNAAGIDVGGSSHWVAVPARSSEESVREFSAMTDDLNAMATWLIACGVDTVALESTGAAIARWGNLQDLADWLDPVGIAMLVNEVPQDLSRRPGSAWAKKALASFKISLAGAAPCSRAPAPSHAAPLR